MSNETGDPNLTLILLIIVGFPIAFVLVWSGVTLILSAIGGWKRIAAAFPGRDGLDGRRHRRVTGMVGWVSYRAVLTVTVTPEGIGITVLPVFKAGHPPLFLPWSAIRNPQRRSWLVFEAVSFTIGEPAVGRMTLPRAVFLGTPVQV